MTARGEKILDDLQKGKTRIDAQGFTIFDARQIDSIEDVEWLVNPLIPRGAVSLIAGKPGVGKSGLVISIMVALATGRAEISGLRPGAIPGPARTAMIGFEDDRRIIEPRLHAVMRAWNVKADEIADRIVFKFEGDSAAVMGAIEHYDLVIVDTFSHLLTDDDGENDNAKITRMIRDYKYFAAKCNNGCWMVHHTRKKPSGAPRSSSNDLDDIRGAGAIAGQVRSGMIIAPAKTEITMAGASEADAEAMVKLDHVKANWGPKSQDLFYRRDSCQWHDDGRSTLLMRPYDTSQLNEAARQRVIDDAEKVFRTMQDLPPHKRRVSPQSPNYLVKQVATALGMGHDISDHRIKAAIAWLDENGRIVIDTLVDDKRKPREIWSCDDDAPALQ